MLAGHIEEIWQYPVKSLAGVRIERALITETGIPGDQCWAVIDAEEGQSGGRKSPVQLTVSVHCGPGPHVR